MSTRPAPLPALVLGLGLLAAAPVAAQEGRPEGTPTPRHWSEAETDRLAGHVQLTFGEQYVRAGEGYFSADMRRIVYQAVPVPPPGREPDEFYAMYVADVVLDASGDITGLRNNRRVSPVGSANTCGWFDPFDSDTVYFATTVNAPTQEEAPGYSRDRSRYRWAFPPEMRVVKVDLTGEVGEASSLEAVIGNETHYQAEGSLSPDGRHMIFCDLEGGDANLYVLDLFTGTRTPLVTAEGYDGGPFFSPEGRRICYRSDRRGNDLLQLYVAELAFDDTGAITGITREHQLTDNEHVNWAPYWHPAGRHLVDATSEKGHWNYEIFSIDADPGDLPGSNAAGSLKYGTRKRSVTEAARADVLPTFSSDGRWMTWTSKRGADDTSQLWAARFVMDLDPTP